MNNGIYFCKFKMHHQRIMFTGLDRNMSGISLQHHHISVAAKYSSDTISIEGPSAEGGGTHIDFHFGARTRPPHCAFQSNTRIIC
jgi:hypothetical protein